MKTNKKLIIISIIVIVAIISAIFAYLIVATDIFKSDKELFAKYISQNIETLQKITDSQTIEVYQTLKNKAKYESNTNIKMTHSEGGEVSNPLNNLSAKLDIQKNDEEQYLYIDGQILFEDEEYWETEVIKQQELYGIRFFDVAKQFVTVKQDGNFEKVATNIGISSEDLETIIDIIDGNTKLSETVISKDEIITVKDKYFNFIKEAVLRGKFNSLKNAMITYNNETVKANVYTVEITNEQVENLFIEILNNLKTETMILEKISNFVDSEEIINEVDKIIKIISEENQMPSIKITVYERNEKTLRTVIDIGINKIVLENIEDSTALRTKIQLSTANAEQVIENNIEISKENTHNQENYKVTIENINAEEKFVISLLSDMTNNNDDEVALNVTIGYDQGIITKNIIIENTVKIAEEFEKKQTLEQNNNVVLNDIEETKQIIIINLLKENLPIKLDDRVELLQKELNPESIPNNNENSEGNQIEISQNDINKFNSKFEFYTGEEVSFENIKTLLEIVRNNISGYEITPITNEGNGSSSNNIKYNFKLNIEQNKQNEEAISKILEKMNERKKYKVSISYKQENGLIDYITINEIGK